LSRNEFNVFLGIWRVGLCVGFSQILSALQPKTGEMSIDGYQGFTFENALVPSLALGASLPIGSSFHFIPKLSAQVDIHEFYKGDEPHRASLSPGWDTANPANRLPGIEKIDFFSVYTQKYTEMTIGGDLGFALRSGSSEFSFGSGLYLKQRLEKPFEFGTSATITHYVSDLDADGDGMMGPYYTDPNATPPATSTDPHKATIESSYTNTQFQLTPYFNYTGAFGDRLTFGFKILADIRFNDSETTPDAPPANYGQAAVLDATGALVEQEGDYGDYEKTAHEVYMKPEIDFGISWALMPQRFMIHAGFGLNLFTFNTATFENKTNPNEKEQFQEVFEEILPSSRFALGLTVNLTANLSVEMLLITSGSFDFKNEPDYQDISSLRRSAAENDKFTLFFTYKR
jgi:hypothetical protein